MSEQAPIEKELRLTTKDLSVTYRDKPPKEPRFYHFAENVTASNFQNATLIIYTDDKGKEYIIKDLYSRRLTKG